MQTTYLLKNNYNIYFSEISDFIYNFTHRKSGKKIANADIIHQIPLNMTPENIIEND